MTIYNNQQTSQQNGPTLLLLPFKMDKFNHILTISNSVNKFSVKEKKIQKIRNNLNHPNSHIQKQHQPNFVLLPQQTRSKTQTVHVGKQKKKRPAIRE